MEGSARKRQRLLEEQEEPFSQYMRLCTHLHTHNTVPELKALSKQLHLSTTGNKRELCQRISDSFCGMDKFQKDQLPAAPETTFSGLPPDILPIILARLPAEERRTMKLVARAYDPQAVKDCLGPPTEEEMRAWLTETQIPIITLKTIIGPAIDYRRIFSLWAEPDNPTFVIPPLLQERYLVESMNDPEYQYHGLSDGKTVHINNVADWSKVKNKKAYVFSGAFLGWLADVRQARCRFVDDLTHILLKENLEKLMHYWNELTDPPALGIGLFLLDGDYHGGWVQTREIDDGYYVAQNEKSVAGDLRRLAEEFGASAKV